MTAALQETAKYWVAVRYGDLKTEVVESTQIKHFSPCSIHDFDTTKIYKVKTKSWNSLRKDELYEGIIEGMGVSKNGAEAARKFIVKNCDPATRNDVLARLKQVSQIPVANSTDAGDDIPDSLDFVEEECARKRAAKDTATLELQRQLVASNRAPGGRRNSSDGDSESECEATTSSQGKPRNKRPRKSLPKDPEAVKRMREERKAHEEAKENAASDWEKLIINHHKPTKQPLQNNEMNNLTDMTQQKPQKSPSVTAQSQPQPRLPSTTSSSSSATASSSSASGRSTVSTDACNLCGSTLESRLAAMEQLQQTQAAQINEILELLRKGVPSVPGPSTAPSSFEIFNKVVVNGRVVLGPGVSCSDIGWQTMNTCKEISDWCVALLRGTFGDDEAMLMRQAPRYQEYKKFSKSFLDVAQVYYGQFLKRRIQELKERVQRVPQDALSVIKRDFFEENHDTLLSQIGANLSDKAENMHRQHEADLIKSGLPVPAKNKIPKTSTKTKPSASRKLLTTPKSLTPRVRKTKPGQAVNPVNSSAQVLDSPLSSRLPESESDIESIDDVTPVRTKENQIIEDNGQEICHIGGFNP